LVARFACPLRRVTRFDDGREEIRSDAIPARIRRKTEPERFISPRRSFVWSGNPFV